MRDRIVKSIREIDFRGLRMPMLAVYDSPEDYPGKVVARLYDLDRPTDIVLIGSAREEIQAEIRNNTGMVFLLRGAEDVRSLVGVWV